CRESTAIPLCKARRAKPSPRDRGCHSVRCAGKRIQCPRALMSAAVPMSRTQVAPRYRQPSIRVSRFTSGLPRVVILHDHEYVPEVLKLLLADRVDVVAQTPSGRAAVALSELLVPDVVVAGEMLIDGVAEYYVPAVLQTGTR